MQPNLKVMLQHSAGTNGHCGTEFPTPKQATNLIESFLQFPSIIMALSLQVAWMDGLHQEV
jgi:hypothetical protein